MTHPLGGSREKIDRIAGAADPAPHAAEHFLALLFLAGGVLVAPALLVLLPLAVFAAAARMFVPRRLLDLQALDAHALRFEHVLELIEAVAEELGRLLVAGLGRGVHHAVA